MMRTGAALAALLVLAGCGTSGGSGGAPSTRAAHIPPPVDACDPTAITWQALPGQGVDAAATGAGPTVVFANDSGNNVCGWLPLAKTLIAGGHRVAVFTYSDPSVQADPQNLKYLLAVASAAAKHQKFVLVGASLGGRLVIDAAARRPAGLTGIVSLSGEVTIGGTNSILAAARTVTLPALYAGSHDDSYTDGVTQQNALHRAMHGNPNELLQRPGSAHGVNLLVGADGAVVLPRIVAFVKLLLGR